jgi:hypothetical protein
MNLIRRKPEREELSMFKLRSALATAATAILLATSSAPSIAYQPVPTHHLVATNLNPKALLAGGQPYSDLGDLQAGRCTVVTPSGITGGRTTVTFLSNDGSGNSVTVGALLTYGVPTLVDFDRVVNPNNDGEMLALCTPQTSRRTSACQSGAHHWPGKSQSPWYGNVPDGRVDRQLPARALAAARGTLG